MPAAAATTIPQLSFDFQRPHRPDLNQIEYFGLLLLQQPAWDA